MSLQSINPATGEVIETYEPYGPEKVDGLVAAAAGAAAQWAQRPVGERAERIARAGQVLMDRREKLGTLVTREMGKVLRQSIGEIEKCAWVCRYYADHGPRFLADEMLESDAARSYVSFEPLGLVLAVMPWNFPFWQVFRFAAPALVAGNGALLKHASNVSGCALAIEEVFLQAGLPEGVFRTLLIPSSDVERVLKNPLVRAATLTGSEPAGRAVAACAGKQLKKTVLELGGSDPYLILEDADLDLAVEKCVTSRLNNCGQTCIAAKRFIVVPEVLDTFTRLLKEKLEAQAAGDPLSDESAIGPMAREDLRTELHRQVVKSVQAGGRLLLGGMIPEQPVKGWYYPPTLLVDVRPGMPVFDEETFGPVAVVVPAKDEADAVRLANQSSFGLGAAVFSRNLERGQEVARRLEAGCVFINDFVKSDPRLPFGGVKESGYGRELSRYGMLEFLNLKTISVL